MRRIPVLIAFLAIMLVTSLVLGFGPFQTNAQDSTPIATGHGFVGSWRLTATVPGSPSTQSLDTFMADGTYLDSDLPVPAGAGGEAVTISTAGHGVWQPTGANTAQVTFVDLVSDLQGNFLTVETISIQATLGADGNTFSGIFSVSVADPSGKVVAEVTGTVQGTRITLEPIEVTPTGSPAA
jgi:hypothetical protein